MPNSIATLCLKMKVAVNNNVLVWVVTAPQLPILERSLAIGISNDAMDRLL